MRQQQLLEIDQSPRWRRKGARMAALLVLEASSRRWSSMVRWLPIVLAYLVHTAKPSIEPAVIFPHMDGDGDTLVSRTELQHFMELASNVLADFYVADTDRNGQVTLQELQDFVPDADETYYSTFIDEFDDSGDGQITLEEWRNHHGYGEEAKSLLWRADSNEDGYLQEHEFEMFAAKESNFPKRLLKLFQSHQLLDQHHAINEL